MVKGKDTSDETMELTYQFMKKAGKYPIKCMKDVPGFVANRLQHALWREAISIVEHGIADAATVDAAIKKVSVSGWRPWARLRTPTWPDWI